MAERDEEKQSENKNPVSSGGKEVPLTRPSDKLDKDVSVVFDGPEDQS